MAWNTSMFAAYAGPQRRPVIDRSLLVEIGDVAVIENQACARKVALAAEIWDSCVHQTIQVGEHITDAGNYASSEIASVLGCSKTVADTYSEIGMDLRLRFPAVRAAFESGELDLHRVRAIYRVTAPYSVDAVERAEVEILSAAKRLSPGPLATEVDAIMRRIAPEEAAELRKDLKRLTGVRYRDKDMIATLEANLEAADAAACWQLVNEMADTLCPRDPRTRGQRRAAAFTTLMHGETYVACTCEADDDHPCTATQKVPDRRTPLTSITIDIETLLGLADLPAYLAGHGDIDADYARELTANSDLQILLTEAIELARGLGHIPGAPDSNGVDEFKDPRPVCGTAHLTFHPLGRGRRRRGMSLPQPASSRTRTESGATTEPYEGRYTLIAALERAIAANPALAVALYPDGHGGFDAPPAGALRYRPGTQLAELVRHRDRTCRHPGCDVPAAGCEIDHVVPYLHHDPQRGGWTVLTNLHCLCKYHHSLKTMGAWTPTMLAGALEYWESSSGTTAVTLPGNTMPGSTVGGGAAPASDLVPHIPRKRGHQCAAGDTRPAVDQSTTAPSDPGSKAVEHSTRVDADDPAPF